MIEYVEALDEHLSRPLDGVAETLAKVGGDLVVLGAGGKIGPTLARMARRAIDGREVFAVSRFRDQDARARLDACGVRTVACDLLDRDAVARLPAAGAVVFLAGTKFGTDDLPATTWMTNAVVPGIVAGRYAGRPTVVLSSGNVYPFVPADGRGATEETPPSPVGEYAWSVLARERVFEHASRARGTPVAVVRLNYAAELRYGVLVDVASRVASGEPVDLSVGWVNVNSCVPAMESRLEVTGANREFVAVDNLTELR